MKKLTYLSMGMLLCGFAFSADWLQDGGDSARTGWVKDEKTLTKANVKGLKLLWKTPTGNQLRALHSLMAPLVVQNVPTSEGPKELVFVVGTSDNLYAFDSSNGKIFWQKHFTYVAPPGRGGGGGGGNNAAPVNPADLGFLGPGGSTDTPVIGPAGPNGHRPLYMTDGGGNLRTIDTANGEELKSALPFTTSKFSLQLYDNMIIAAGRGGINGTKLDDPARKVYTTIGYGGGGGLWGRRGPAIDSQGIVWTTTGDGQYNPTAPNGPVLGNSVVGFKLQGDNYKVVDWFTPSNWDWLRKRDLDPNNTPTLFMYKGRELMAASGKECRVYLLDPKNLGGDDHHTPLYKTPLFCNEEVDFQDMGSWGALSTWEEANGTRWILAPFWGPAHSKFKFPIVNQPVAKEGGEAAFKLVEKAGKLELEPAWVSRDMHRGEPPLIANGMVFGYGSGEETKQAWPDSGLDFTSSVRAAKSKTATIFVLDALTGKELWSSGDQVKSFNHFSGLGVANGKVYIGTYDGTFYCFGL